MRTSEIRQRWFDHFRKHDHHIAPSVPLVSPDPSILFTIAGMVPFIPYIVGTEPAPWPRVASVQKCLRTNDIENVGRTTRHGTFFQMCGNFSFGDYFKEGAINFAWELLTNPVAQGGYGLDGEKIWVTIWEQDQVAFDCWTKEIGLDPKHIVKLKREENFWSTGQPGPAGPCAEIHYDRGAKYGPEAVGGTVDPGGDRYLEIWNLVFDEFLRGPGEGKDYPLLGNLAQTAIDTGAGLERIAYLLQGKENMYEIDEVYPLIAATEELTAKRYHADAEDDVRMRVIADHVRSALMLIGDGVRPGNDGRGYVLRRLLRRAVRSIRLLGVEDAALNHLLPVAKDAMKASYPELETDFGRISQIAYEEEDAFRRTLNAGTTILDTAVKKALKESGSAATLSGKDAFTLHDTYGFPIDLTLEMASEQGVKVDAEGFQQLMREQKERARKDAQAKKTGHVDASIYKEILEGAGKGQATEFLGYTQTQESGRILALLLAGQSVASVEADVNGEVVDVDVILDRTPFWAEQGGQLADHGVIRTEGGTVVNVKDVQMPIKGLFVHRAELRSGQLIVDENVVAEIDVNRRQQIACAHTATHMVHKALHELVGEQATQAGSENSPSRLRFDFRHGQALESAVIADLEARVNEQVRANLEVGAQIMDLEEAKASGAMALFGEKYGREVRVVSIGGNWSRELCAGTHVDQTGALGQITLLGESSIGSGVRRIEALVGSGAYDQAAKQRVLLSQLLQMQNCREDELISRLETLMARLKQAEKELDSLRQSQIGMQVNKLVEALISNPAKGAVPHALVANLGVLNSADALRTAALDAREQLNKANTQLPATVALFAVIKDRPALVVATNEAARNVGIKAGALVKQACQLLGGGGGGRDDVAQGGGQNIAALDSTITAVQQVLAG